MIMEATPIARSPEDEFFRRAVRQLLDEATERVRIIAGEFGAYRYSDLREGVQNAVHRGVPVEAFGNQRSPEAILMERDGVDVTVGGLRSLHHYFVCDDMSTIVSFKEPRAGPTRPGTRTAELYRDDREMAAAVAAYQRFLELASRGMAPSSLLEGLAKDIEAHPLLARRICLADNVLEAVGVEGPTASLLVGSILASLRPSASHETPSGGELEERLAIANQMAILSAAILLAQNAHPGDPPLTANATISASAVDEARRSLERTVPGLAPSKSIWEATDG
jgi:hypothetical protein